MLKIKKNIHKKTLISIILFFGFSFCFFNISSFNECYKNGQCVMHFNETSAKTGQYGDIKNVDYAGNFQFLILAPLMALLRLEGFLINVSIDLIVWTMSSEFLGFLNNKGLYSGWTAVRDILNLFFIFFLLYSAFCTIFQISRYHIKSTWVMIVLMALLVNFSWPITRIMIDISNVTMLYLIGSNDDISSYGLLATFGKESKFLELMLGSGNISQGRDWQDSILTYFFTSGKGSITVGIEQGFLVILFLGIIVGFILLVTFLTLALMLVIRVIVLAVLIVFSPVGFVLAGFPSTKSYASKWWDELLKQLIAGPVLLFCLIIAVVTLQNMELTMPSDVENNSVIHQITATFLRFSVTIVLIWSGMIMAKQVGAAGSEMAMGFSKKINGWGKKVLVGGAAMGATFVGRRADIAGGKLSSGLGGSGRAPSSYVRNIGQRWKNMSEAEKKRYDGYVEESKAAGLSNASGMGGDRNASRRLHSKKVLEEEKKIKEDGVSHEEAMDIARDNNASAAKRQAALNHAMKSDKFGEGAAATGMHADFVGLIDSLNHLNATEKAALRDQMEKKYIENGNALHIMQARMDPSRGEYRDELHAYDEMFRGMSGKVLGAQESLMNFINQQGTVNTNLRTQLRDRFQNNQQLQNQFLQNASENAVNRARAAQLL